MLDDAGRWNQKYRANLGARPGPCDPLLRQHRTLLEARGDALDVACGKGQNARYLAECGNRVVAVDISMVALRACRQHLAGSGLPVSLLAMNLDCFRPPSDSFDLIVVFRYLNRPLIPFLKAALRPRGLIVYATFNANYLREKPAFNPRFVLELGELSTAFADMQTLSSNDSKSNREPLSYWVGRKP